MDIEKVTYALSALLESCYQIHNIARNGIVDEKVIGALLRGVLKVEPQNTECVYPKSCLIEGYTYFADLSKFEQKTVTDLTRYMFELYKLTDKYKKLTEARESLGALISSIRKNLANEVEKCKYTATTLSNWYKTNIFDNHVHQIPIYGEKEMLTNERNMHFIRALFVAGIRSSILWEQVGGTQFGCLWNKSRIAICAKDTLTKIQEL